MKNEENLIMSKDDTTVENGAYSGIFSGFVESEKKFRLVLEKVLVERQVGRITNQVTAIISGASTLIYVAITYLDHCPVILENWFNKLENIICYEMLTLYLLTIYVK
jgi:hypothetical protein